MGIATNNPVEQFNHAIKRDYTNKTRVKVNGLMDHYADIEIDFVTEARSSFDRSTGRRN